MYAFIITTSLFSRLLSRVVIIPFKGPSIQAKTQEQRLCFTNLKYLKEQASNSIGHYISLAAKYRQTGCFEVDQYEGRLGAMLPKCGGRTVKGYANLIWFTEQVSNTALQVASHPTLPSSRLHSLLGRQKKMYGQLCRSTALCSISCSRKEKQLQVRCYLTLRHGGNRIGGRPQRTSLAL